MSKKNKNKKDTKSTEKSKTNNNNKDIVAVTLNDYKEQLLDALHFCALKESTYQDVNFGTLFIKNVNGRIIITTAYKVIANDYYALPSGGRDRMGTGFTYGLTTLSDNDEVQFLTIPEKFDYETLIIKERAKQLKSPAITRLNAKSQEIINALNYEDKKSLEERYENSYIPTYYLLHKHSTSLKPNQLRDENYHDLVEKEVKEAIESAVAVMQSLQSQQVFQTYYVVGGQALKDLISYTFSGAHLKQELLEAHLSTLNAIEDAKFNWDDKINTFLNELKHELLLQKREIDSYNDSSNAAEDAEIEYMNIIYNINLETYVELENHMYKRVSDENGKPYTRLDFINDTK